MADQLLSLDAFADGALLQEVREAMALLGSELSREDIAGKGGEGLGCKCEGCEHEAVTRDSDGVPLCGECYDALDEVPTEKEG